MLDEEEEEVEKVEEEEEEEVVERQHEESLEMRLPSPGANHSFTLCIIFWPGRVLNQVTLTLALSLSFGLTSTFTGSSLLS